MNDVGPATRALLDAAGPVASPPPEAVERMLHGVVVKASVAAAASSLTNPQTLDWLQRLALAGKKAKLVGALVALGGGAAVLGAQRLAQVEERPLDAQGPAQQQQEPAQPLVVPAPSPSPQHSATPLPPPDGPQPSAEAELPPGDRASTRKPARRRDTPRARSARPREQGASSNAANPLQAELKLIRAAQAALASHDLGQATRLVHQHARRFPNGVLTEERLGIEALAHCEGGGNGGPAARRLLREMPASPMARRVREACKPSTGTQP